MNTFLTGLSVVAFGVATYYGARTFHNLHIRGRWQVGYMAAVAAANFVFRCYTFTYRAAGWKLNSAVVVPLSLVLQFALGMALLVGLSAGYWRGKALKNGGE